MKQLVICSKDFINYYTDVLSSGELILNNVAVNFALIEAEDIAFDPEKTPHKVLVKKAAFSCNYREIALILKANAKVNTNPLTYYAIGSEFSGVVINLGKEVTQFKIGDRVMCNGSYPNTMSVDAAPGLPTNHASTELEAIHEHKLVLLPENMPLTTAAAFTIGAQTIYSMLDRLHIKDHDNILITGIQSNTSLFALNALKKRNVTICGLSRTPLDVSQFHTLGLKHIFYNNDKEHTSLVHSKDLYDFMVKNGRFDHVIDPFGDSNLFRIIDLININGKYITCGISNQSSLEEVSIKLNSEIGKIIMGNITIMGNCLGGTEHLNKAIHDFKNNDLNVIINKVLYTDAQKFMTESFVAKSQIGKVVFSYEENQ